MIEIEPIATERLALEPLTTAHARRLFPGLRDPALYQHLDEGPPASVEVLEERYRRWERLRSPDDAQRWLNWAVRDRAGYVGHVQATITGPRAEIAYVLFVDAWGRGYAGEAVAAMIEYLRSRHAIDELVAQVSGDNRRSIALLARLGFVHVRDELYVQRRVTSSPP